MLAPRTPTADGIGLVLVYPGAVLRSNTVVPMALLSAHVAGGCAAGVHGLAYALVASWICVQPITMCPDSGRVLLDRRREERVARRAVAGGHVEPARPAVVGEAHRPVRVLLDDVVAVGGIDGAEEGVAAEDLRLATVDDLLLAVVLEAGHDGAVVGDLSVVRLQRVEADVVAVTPGVVGEVGTGGDVLRVHAAVTAGERASPRPCRRARTARRAGPGCVVVPGIGLFLRFWLQVIGVLNAAHAFQ